MPEIPALKEAERLNGGCVALVRQARQHPLTSSKREAPLRRVQCEPTKRPLNA